MRASQPKIIAELSAGTTLEAGSVICMGTPPPLGRSKGVDHWLKDGELCKCTISGVGALALPVFLL
jgi:2-keto-4-pentenoate hydratase/2-oxohepta-3-ene-1,7-dioic acid hydratase in catechol pathway